jgi:hypothetical protein
MLSEKDIQARDALDAAMHEAGEGNRFWGVRGMAIQSYALLEQALGDLFAGLSDTNPIIAGITFFRLTSTRARNTILEKLFKNKFRSEYNLFRNSLFKQLPPIDIERNQIVHWNAINEIARSDDGTSATGTLFLQAPFLWMPDERGPRLSIDDLLTFIEKCIFFAAIVRMFSSIIVHHREFYGFSPDFQDAWRDIFQQPITYPPPADHPSRRMQSTRGIPPPP